MSAERRASLAFLAVGALSLAAQVFLLRELIVALAGDETALGLGLAAWLGGIGTGAAAARRHAPRRRGTPLAALAVASTVLLVAVRFARGVVGTAPGEPVSLGPAALLAFAVLFVPGAFSGAAFVALARTAEPPGGARSEWIARLYGLEAAGSLLCGLAATFVFIPADAPLASLAALAGACLVLALPLLSRRAIAASAALALLAVALPPVARGLERWSQRAAFASLAPGQVLVDAADTPYQRLMLGEGGGIASLFASGQYAMGFPDAEEAEAAAHRLACLAPQVRRVALVGGAWNGALRFLLRHPVEHVDLVLPDPGELDLAAPHLASEDRAALRDPRVAVVTDDPRRFLARGGAPYDLVAVLEPEPVTLLAARLATVEFYRVVEARLTPEGVFVARLTSDAATLTGTAAALDGALWRTLSEAFPVVRAAPAPASVFIAGRDPRAVTLDAATLAGRFAARRIAARAIDGPALAASFGPEGIATLEEQLRGAARLAPDSTDDRPAAFLFALARRQKIARSAAAPLFEWAALHPRRLALLALVPSLALLALVALRQAGGRAAALHAVAVAGACGMTWNLALSFAYQTRAGALYGRLALLAALFMGGLAAGAFALRRAGRRGLTLACAGGALFAALLPLVLMHEEVPGWLVAALLPPAGAATAAFFPAAVGTLVARGRDAVRAGAAVQGADHLGGAAAALVASTLLLPALGVSLALWVSAAWLALALAALTLAGRR